MANPYGNGNAAKTIAGILTTVPLEDLLIKQAASLHRPSLTPLRSGKDR